MRTTVLLAVLLMFAWLSLAPGQVPQGATGYTGSFVAVTGYKLNTTQADSGELPIRTIQIQRLTFKSGRLVVVGPPIVTTAPVFAP